MRCAEKIALAAVALRLGVSLGVATQTKRSAVEGYPIAPNDVLNVYIVDVPELSRDYRVGASGTVTLPLLSESIVAAGLTLEELSAVIARRLKSAGLVGSPQVLVTVKSSTARSVAIMGAIKTPQIYPAFGPTTILDVLAQGGGLDRDAGDTAVITRGEMAMQALQSGAQSGDKERPSPTAGTVKVDLERLLKTGDPNLNLTIYPGDKVTVERAPIVYVVGAVNRAGGFPMTGEQSHMTVLKALALAQSLTPTAQRKKAFIIRENPQRSSQREDVPLNLERILSGKSSDLKLEANDVLFVPDSAAKKALGPAVQAALQTISGVVIWRQF